jgi:hypothetical protein
LLVFTLIVEACGPRVAPLRARLDAFPAFVSRGPLFLEALGAPTALPSCAFFWCCGLDFLVLLLRLGREAPVDFAGLATPTLFF